MKVLNANRTVNKRILNLIKEEKIQDIFSSVWDEDTKDCYITDSKNDRLSIIFEDDLYFIFIIENDRLVFEEEFNLVTKRCEDIHDIQSLRALIKKELQLIASSHK